MQHGPRGAAAKNGSHAGHHLAGNRTSGPNRAPQAELTGSRVGHGKRWADGHSELKVGGSIGSEVEFYSWLNKLTQAIIEMVDAKVPKIRSSLYQ